MTQRRAVSWVVILVAAATLSGSVGCSKKAERSADAAQVSGEKSSPGNFLAYEHSVSIEVDKQGARSRLDAARAACVAAQFGACSVLAIEQGDGEHARATLKVRIVPEGVEPLVNLAAQGGKVGSRKTKAEDLAEVAGDTVQRRELLERQKAKLLEFEARKDLSVTDALTVANQLAALEVQLESTIKAAADQQRRIETNLLTMEFYVDYKPSRGENIGKAFNGMLDSLEEGIAAALEAFGYGLPFLLIAFPLALIWRWLWRKATRRSAGSSAS
jgi:Domain of unknown function (DUF4349)